MEKKIIKSICENIRILRLKHNWNQKELADRMGISIPAYSKIETGYTDVNLSRIAQIAEIYDISVFQLLMSEDGEMDPEASSHIAMLQKKLASREAEIEILLRKIIELYEGYDHKKLAQ